MIRTTDLVITASFLATLSTVMACAPNYGEGRFEVSAATQYEECLAEAFPLVGTFFAARQRPASTGLFIQTRGGLDASYDLVYLEVHQPEAVTAQLGEPIALSAPNDPAPVVVAKVLLRDSCPTLYESFYVLGSVVFDVLSPDEERRVEGAIRGGSLVNARTNETVASIEGSWAYDVLRGPPHEEFYPF